MKAQHMIPTLFLALLGLLGNALNVTVRAADYPVLPSGPCSCVANGAGIASVSCKYNHCLFPTGVPHEQSCTPLAAQINTTWTPVTETYTTTSMDVITPHSRTETYTDLSTELTTTTLDVKTTTQTIVEIAGYSTIDTYTTTFLAPASSSTYSMVETVTTTSWELLVPSVATLTLTGSLSPSLHSFPTMRTQKRGLAWVPAENSTGVGVWPSRNLASSTAGGHSTAPPSIQHTASAGPTHGFSTLTSAKVPEAGPLVKAESAQEGTSSSSTNVMVITVTNTYSITPASEHTSKTFSRSANASATWLVVSPVPLNTTHHHHRLSTLTIHNTSALMNATTTRPDANNTLVHMTSVEAAMTVSERVTGTVSPISASGCGMTFNGLIQQIRIAILAITFFFVF